MYKARQPRQLPEVLAAYKSAVKKANLDLDSVPQANRPAFGIAKRKATDDLPDLKGEYLARALKTSIAAFAVGSPEKAAEFAAVAAKAGGSLTVDANATYAKMADKIWPSLGRTREFSVHQAALLDQALKELALDTGYTGRFESIKIRKLKVVSDRDELVDYVRELVFASNGVTPAVVAAQNQILEQALKAEFAGRMLAVVVVNAEAIDRQAISSMFTRTVEARVDDAEQIDERFARNVFEGTPKPKAAPVPAQNASPDTNPETQQNQDQE